MAVISLHLLIILKFHFATKFYFTSGSCLTLVNSRKCCLMSNRMICFRIKEVGNVCRSNNVRILPSGTIVRESGRSHFFNKAQIIPMDEPAEGGRNDLEEGRSPSSHDWSSLFPRFKECAHFHYEHVNIPGIQLSMVGEKFEVDNYSSSQTQWWLYVLVSSEVRGWTIKRTLTSLLKTDKLLHQCIFNRSASQLPELQDTIATDLGLEKCFKVVANYIESLSTLLQRNIDLVSCGPILAWLEVDNRGNHVSIMEMDSSVNIPAIGAAQVIKPYVAQSSDELTFEVGDIISIIEKPPPHETTWWHGKKDFKVGYFPSECVELITVSSKSQTPEKSQQQLIKPVLRKREKFVTFLLSFFSSRPNKTSLKRAGIVKERVFGCDLGEHLSNHDDDVPVILTSCIKFIEEKCITDGVYRLSGAVTSVQKLRCEFDADKVPDLNSPDIVQDLHCVPSLIKMYFRELPNPLLTHQLYDRFLEVQEQKDGTSKLRSFACLMNLLPPPHYRTAKMLFLHLNLMASKHLETSMSSRNLAIIWAPNILQPRQEDQALNLLKKTNMQAAIVDNIISNAEIIFKDLEIKQDSKSGRPLSYVNAPAKLISLDEAQKIFGGRNKDLPSPLEKVAGREGRPLQIHSIINVPKGFVGRKKTTPLKAKWFTSHQDLPSLAKPVEMTDFKRIGSSKRGGDAYQSGSVKINLQPRTPFSDSSPVRTRISLGDVVDSPDDFGACNPLCNSDPNILESADILGEEFASTDAQNDPEMTRDLTTPVVKLLPSPKLDFKLAKENLTKTNPAENVVSKVSSEKKMNPESKNENQTKVAAKREPGTMLKKMEKFLQGEVIEEENDTPQKGGPSDAVDQKSASVEFSTRQEKIKEDSSAIMNELKKWKEMKESNNSVSQNLITNTNTRNCRKNLTASFSLNLPEKADKSRRPFVGGRQETIVFVGDSGKHSTEGMKVEPPKKHVDEFQMSSDSKSFQPSMQSTNQNNSSIDFNPPPDCCGSSYVERILPRRNAAGRNFIRRSLCQSSAFTEQKCDYRGASLVTRNPCNIGRLPEEPPSVNLSLSCGDLFITNPPSYGAFLSPSSFPKSNSNENIFSRGSRLYKHRQVCRSATDHRPLSLRPTDQNFRKVPTDTNTKDLQRPSMKVHYSYPPENMPHNLQPAQEKFVTVINLDSPEQRPNLQTPGSTVIIL